MDDRSNLIVDVEAQLEETSDLVSRGWSQQQITSELLADTFTAEGQAKEAIKKAERTLTEAKETLTALEGNHFIWCSCTTIFNIILSLEWSSSHLVLLLSYM